MPRRFKQVRRRLSAFVRVGDCRPRSVKTLVSESAYMGNSALPSGLECGGSLQREVQPLCNRCRSGLDLHFEPVRPGASSCEAVGFTTIVPSQGCFAVSAVHGRDTEKRPQKWTAAVLLSSTVFSSFPAPAGNRSKRALSLAVLPMAQAVSQTAPHSGRCPASAYPACWAPASTARFPVAGGSACTWPEKALGHLVHEIAV